MIEDNYSPCILLQKIPIKIYLGDQMFISESLVFQKD